MFRIPFEFFMLPRVIEEINADLRAAVLAEIPIQLKEQPRVASKASSIFLIDEIEKELTSSLSKLANRGIESDQLSKLLMESDQIPAGYSAAVHAYAIIGSTAPVLDGLSAAAIARRESRQALRPALIYLAVLLFASFLGLSFFAFAIEPLIGDLKLDAIKTSRDGYAFQSYEHSNSFRIFSISVGSMALIAGIWLLAGGFKKVIDWLGGDAYSQAVREATALTIMLLLRAANASRKQAADICCDLVGIPADRRGRIIDAAGLTLPETTAEIHRSTRIAEIRLRRMRQMVPILIVAIAGGCICLLYAGLVFWPITDMLNELGRIRV